MITPLPSRTPIDATEADLLELLRAYQHLQGQNLVMSAHLSAELGLSSTELRTMLFLFRNENVSPKDLAIMLQHTTGSITALVDKLETSGHLERRAHPTDRRKQILRLTDTGTAAVQHVRDAFQDAFQGVFSEQALRAAATTLRSLGDALTPHPPVHEQAS